MVFGLRALHPPHPLRLQQLHRLPASWHLPLPRAHHCLSCRPWRCRSLVRLLADIPRQAGLPPQSDRAYASSSSCDGKRACACAPKASAADARVQKIARPRAGPEVVCLLPAAAATSDLCMCPERPQWQSQRVQGCARMQPTDLWATSECRTHRPASKAPLPVRPSRAPERQSATGGAHGAAAGGQAAPPDDLAEGPAPFYRRLRRSPPRHVARCTSPCRAVAVGCDCHPWAGRTGHEGLRLQLRFLERGYTARQLGGCALRAARPLCAAQAVVAVGAVAETAG